MPSSPNADHAALRAHRLEYLPLDEELAVVRLVAGLSRALPRPSQPSLVLGAPQSVLRVPALGSVIQRPSRLRRTSDQIPWRVTFAAPLELVECRDSLFGLVADGYLPARLPDPRLADLAALSEPWEVGSLMEAFLKAVAWRRATALGTAVAVAGSTIAPPALALASSSHHRVKLQQPAPHHRHHPLLVVSKSATGHPTAHHISHAPASARTTPHDAKTGASTSAATSSSTVRTSAEHHARHAHHRADGNQGQLSTRTKHSAGAPSHPISAGSVTPSPPAASAPASRQTAGATEHRSAGGGAKHRHYHRHTVAPDPRPTFTGGVGLSTLSPTPPVPLGSPKPKAKPRPKSASPHRRHLSASGGSGESAANPGSAPVSSPSVTGPSGSFWTTGTGIGSAEVALMSHLSGLFAKVNQPPPFLVPIYKRAGKRFHIPWQVLAAINSIETNYGRDLNVSSAGAVGWMQFMPSTWKEYGMSVDGHGAPNPYDPTDAIFSAARYLAANGGGKHLRKAVFAYNHATWYVDEVLWRAGMITDHAGKIHHLHGYALPLDAKYMHTLGRTDDGVDIETAPDGAAVYSMTPGVVTAVASDPSGFGPNYPVIRVTRGPLLGQYIYYGHVAASLVKVGQHVLAGQPIAIMGHTGDAASLGHGHIEIGFSDGQGDPINHHGLLAWTPSGAAMRHVMVALAASFGIKSK